MSMQGSPPSTPESQIPVVGKKYITCPHCGGKYMTAEELNEHWADVYLAQESKIAILTKMEKEQSPVKNHSYVAKLEELEEQRKNKIIEYEVYTTKLEETVNGANTRITELEETVEKQEVKLHRFETLPLRYHIAELKGFGEDFEAAKEVADSYVEYSVKELEEKIKDIEEIHGMYVDNEEYEQSEDGQIETEEAEQITNLNLEGDELLRAHGFDPDEI